MTTGTRAGKGALGTASLLLATMTTGLTAGIFADWSIAVMPGLRDLDDRTFVLAFQGLDSAIIGSPLFLGVGFTGALLFTVLAAAFHLRGRRTALPWILAALVCYLAAFVITMAVNEPLNQTLREAGDLTGQFATARAQLEEASWTAWNTVRAVASTIAFGCLGWALVIHRR